MAERTKLTELPVEIRLMGPEDADEVLYVARRLPEYFHEGGVKYIGRAVGNRTGLVGVYGGQVIGFVIYDVSPPTVEILWMGVLPFYQGRGVGRRLVEALIDQLGPAGQEVTTLEARTLAPHELAGIDKGHFTDGTDAAVYRKGI